MRSFLIKAVLVLGVAGLLVEGYYVYQSYDTRSVATTTASETSSPGRANEPGSSTTGKLGDSDVSFVHRATSANTADNSTYLDNPSTNNNPGAVLSATQNWNPEGGVGTYNDHQIGVWYDPNVKQWAIFNQDQAPMPEGAAFNVTIMPDSTR